MDLAAIVKRYQTYDRETGGFTATRSLRGYARLLGLTHSQLSRFYSGQIDAPWHVLRALLRVFPEATYEVVDWLKSDRPVRTQKAA